MRAESPVTGCPTHDQVRPTCSPGSADNRRRRLTTLWESSALQPHCPRCVIRQRSSLARHASKQASAWNLVSRGTLRSDRRKKVHPHSVCVLTRLHAKRLAINSAVAFSRELCAAPASMTIACRGASRSMLKGCEGFAPRGALIRARVSKCILLHVSLFLARVCGAVSAAKGCHADQPLVRSH